MTGPHDSVIGVKAELATQRMRTGMPVRFETARRVASGSKARSSTCDAATGRATAIEPVRLAALTGQDEQREQRDETEVAGEHEPRGARSNCLTSSQ